MRSRRDRVAQLLVVAVAVVLAVTATALLVRAVHNAEGSADRQSAAFTPPPLSPTPTLNASARVAASRLVTVISDQTTAGAPGDDQASLWPQMVGEKLNALVSAYADAGTGYVTEADGGNATFLTSAARIDPTSKVVVFFGGANDAGKPALRIVRAASEAIAAARTAAPRATIIVVGPAWAAGAAPASVLSTTSAVRAAAGAARVRFVDPITSAWLEGSGDLTRSDHLTPTTKGQRVLAARMAALIATALS